MLVRSEPYDDDDDDDPHQSKIERASDDEKWTMKSGGTKRGGDISAFFMDFYSVVYGLGKVQLIKIIDKTYS